MAWSDTPEGSNVNSAYEAFKTLYNQTLPNHIQNLANLAARPIKG
jgi:hypothetical protein